MRDLNRIIVSSKFGVLAADITWNRVYVTDELVDVSDEDDEVLTLTAANIVPRAPIYISLCPYLLSKGATVTSIVNEGDTVCVFVPPQIDGIDLNQCFIRGYLL